MKPRSPTKMIYTPVHRIPIGEAIKRPDGTYALRVKKPSKDEFDEIPLETLCSSVVMSAERNNITDREPPPSRHPSYTTSSSI